MSTPPNEAFLAQIIRLLKEIPNVVWSAIIASLITLSGVWLSNRNSRNLQQNQLRHDAERRNSERELALRKEVYLEALESISISIARISHLNPTDFANNTTQKKELWEGIVQESTSYFKTAVVGSNETFQFVSALTYEVNSITLMLFLKKYNIFLVEERIKTINDASKKLEIMSNKIKLDFEYIRLFTDSNIKINQLTLPVIFAIRKELNLPIDEKAFKMVSDEYQIKTKNEVANFLNGLVTEMQSFLHSIKPTEDKPPHEETQNESPPRIE